MSDVMNKLSILTGIAAGAKLSTIVQMIAPAITLLLLFFGSVSAFAEKAAMSSVDAFQLPRCEFAKYYEQITGKKPDARLVTFGIDGKISQKGKDAYSIRSEGDGVKLTGSNLRCLFYAVYDLLERRGGCRWFWDGDIVPKRDSLDFSGLDVFEEAQFEYRGLRYFAHRGLTRFQAEHWGLEDWKKEIDWCLKRRINVFMLRIGQDDLFQRTYPSVVSYPDASADLPGHGKGYDNRTLFWSLEYRGRLRQAVQAYALDRGLMVPEDFGTMTHWYSRTPEEFLNKVNPPFLPQATEGYSEKNGLVWDIRDDKWVDAYWNLTKAAVRDYNRPNPELLHTIGLGERLCYTNRDDNLKLKMLAIDKFIKRAHTDYPDSKILLAGWDFYFMWFPEEVQALVKTLDPKHVIIWDYEGDALRNYRDEMKDKDNNFTKWGVVGKFPYTFSVFLAFESALDIRANYPLIEERQKIVQNDPFCVGYIFWPEASHTDTLLLRHFTENAWRKGGVGISEVLPEFCRDRYGKDAGKWQGLWEKVSELGRILDWTGNYWNFAVNTDNYQNLKPGYKDYDNAEKWLARKLDASLLCTPEIFRDLAKVDWKKTSFTERDAIDLARTAADRLIIGAHARLLRAYHEWKAGSADADDVRRFAAAYVSLTDLMAEVLALHTDYSLAESYDRLDAIEKIRNPNFSKVLVENATCTYCASHQYEAAEYWYKPSARDFASDIARRVTVGDRSPLGPYERQKAFRDKRMFAQPLSEMRPGLPRTQKNFVRVMNALAAAADVVVRQPNKDNATK
ncbi:MAG: hypothetical protein J6R18_03080 [Kiritimatiellae bacterium]|nr:hypothetical protein [Kiritimatiellia bacterium]